MCGGAPRGHIQRLQEEQQERAGGGGKMEADQSRTASDHQRSCRLDMRGFAGHQFNRSFFLYVLALSG